MKDTFNLKNENGEFLSQFLSCISINGHVDLKVTPKFPTF